MQINEISANVSPTSGWATIQSQPKPTTSSTLRPAAQPEPEDTFISSVSVEAPSSAATVQSKPVPANASAPPAAPAASPAPAAAPTKSARPAHSSAPVQSSTSTSEAATISSSYSTTIAGVTYSGSVTESDGTYTCTLKTGACGCVGLQFWFVRRRWMGAFALAQAQAAPANAPATQGATHLVLPPGAQGAAAGVLCRMGGRRRAEEGDRPGPGRPGQRRGSQGVRLYRRRAGRLQAERRDAEPARAALSRRQRRLRRVFVLSPEWLAQGEIGTGATSNHNRVLFWVGNTVVDANFSRIGPMSGSELRELAGQLPVPEGGKALAPPILATCPRLAGRADDALCLGPAGYAGAGGVLPPELVGFDRGAEAVTATTRCARARPR
jgi:hypothetical protein